MKPHPDEFYVGWQDRAPSSVGRRIRRFLLLFLPAIAVLAAALPVAQRTIGHAVFEWGDIRSFAGVLQLDPYPHLLLESSDPPGTGPRARTWHLVAPFKFGLDREPLRALAGRRIKLRGTRIYRDDEAMIEVAPGSIEAVSDGAPAAPEPAQSLGRQTLVGEIVDSKCFLGVMNPGALTPHRACAVRCISGGIPPVLLVRQTDGTARYYLLVSTAGRPVNREVLDLVAEPVSITGEVIRQGEQLILRADPHTFRPLNRR